MKPIRINYREKVPCFGNEPKTDLELLRRISADCSSNLTAIKIMAGGLLAVAIIAITILILK